MDIRYDDSETGTEPCSGSTRRGAASVLENRWSRPSTIFSESVQRKKKGVFGFALWMFVETSAGIVRENLTSITMERTTRRLMVWAGVVALVLLMPLVAIQFTEEVNWSLFDFAYMGALLFGTGLAYELLVRKAENIPGYRAAVGVAVVAAFLLVWVNAAVGIIGDGEEDLANAMYVGGGLAVGIMGALFGRFQPRGMARALCGTALTQILVAVIALVFGLGSSVPGWPRDLLMLTGFFATLWVGSAVLFLRADAFDRT